MKLLGVRGQKLNSEPLKGRTDFGKKKKKKRQRLSRLSMKSQEATPEKEGQIAIPAWAEVICLFDGS